jgi:predicted branched-subunit amino acid permease
LITISSTFVVNSRHLLYGASFSEYLKNLSLGWKILLSYLLTDQAYAVSNIYFEKNKNNNLKHYYLLGSGFFLWFIWQISTLIGIFLGSIVPDKLGLSYTIPLTFIALLVGYFRKFDHIIIILLSGFLSIILYNVPLKSYIILSSFISLFVALILIILKKGKN